MLSAYMPPAIRINCEVARMPEHAIAYAQVPTVDCVWRVITKDRVLYPKKNQGETPSLKARHIDLAGHLSGGDGEAAGRRAPCRCSGSPG